MHATIRDVSALLGWTIDKRIHITLDLRAKGATVMADPNQLRQALLNLAVNARDAMPEGGELSVHTGAADLDEAYCQTHPWAAPGRYLVIAMTDTGHGIPKHVQDRVFRALREINPDVKAVLSTGYGRNGRAQAPIDEGMVGFVQKPYHLKELSEAVAAALNQ